MWLRYPEVPVTRSATSNYQARFYLYYYKILHL